MKWRYLPILFLVLSILSISGQAQTTIEGNKVYINDSKTFISAEPHTLYSSGYVYFTVVAKNYTGNVDLTLGVNTDSLNPVSAELYNPHVIQLPNESNSQLLNYVSNISILTNPQQGTLSFGNIYNRYCRKVDYKTFDNVTWNDLRNINVCFDDYIVSGTNYTISWNTTFNKAIPWLNVADRFDSVAWDFDGFNKWYYAQNMSVEAGKTYTVRVFVNVLRGTKAKYGFAIKPSSQSLQQAKDSGTLYYLDPWIDSTRLKKKYIQINNTNGSLLADYSNISMNLSWETGMNPDFSDLIIYNETTGVQQWHWFEDRVNNTNATIYLNISSIPANTWLNDTIAIYFGLPSATYNNTLGGLNTFPLYDHFDDATLDATKWNVYSGQNYSISGGILTVTGANDINDYINSTKLFGVNYAWKSKSQWVNKFGSSFFGFNNFPIGYVGVNSYDSDGYRYTTYVTGYNNDGATVDANWHTIEMIRNSTIDVFFIQDGISVFSPSSQIPSGSLNVVFREYGGGYQQKHDYVLVKSHTYPAPSILIGDTLQGQYIPPVPINLTYTSNNVSWINHTWAAGTGNVTDSYNVSVNGVWTNGSANTYYNHTGLSPGDWSNISVYAYNNTGIGSLNLTNVSQNIQLPFLPIYVLNGTVNNSLGAPLEWVKLSWNGISVYSNATGFYEFSNATSGTHILTAQQIGYDDYSETFNLGANTTKNITLIEKETVSEGTVIDYSLVGATIGGLLAFVLLRKKKKDEDINIRIDK